ncbi:hypothetical protein CAPTEDRAFT_224095 [Capitella teleta]|uniref:Neurotransmitter-gated ion-channel ligand-binding domain-containing protein n=1 Tax=Capitella teleta TaxID=283909 RepID=R7UCN3_CAPTE|nr:hypothetical protein CAPTEDRAFT_224095 [Capitella teleta]|eukprot:ELU01543.1 hypothetical protein CAPTEDRAFT_224095 [Capitella teleta]
MEESPSPLRSRGRIDSLPPITSETAHTTEFIPDSTPKPKLQKVKTITRKDKVDVQIKIKFLKIGDICTAEEMFKATVFMQAKWLEPSLDHPSKKFHSFELLNPEDYWTPSLSVDNLLDEGKSKLWHLVSYNRHGKASIIQRATVRGSFHESMELVQFPFDSQELTITVTTNLDAEKICLHIDDSESMLNPSNFSDCSEWFLHEELKYQVYNPTQSQIAQVQAVQKRKMRGRSQVKPCDQKNSYVNDVMTSENVYGASEATGDEHEMKDDEVNLPRSTACVMAKATRKPMFYVLNITLFMMILGALIFSTFAIECSLIGNRLQTTSTIMLSNIAFKLAVGNAMPRVSYFTYMDFYILITLVQMGLVLGWHAVVKQLCGDDDNDSTALWADKIALMVLGAFYVLFNTVFLTKNLTRVYRISSTSA